MLGLGSFIPPRKTIPSPLQLCPFLDEPKPHPALLPCVAYRQYLKLLPFGNEKPAEVLPFGNF